MKHFEVLVLISGRGSNLKSLIDNARDYTVSSVISNSQRAAGLAYAREHMIPNFTFERADFESVAKLKTAIFEQAIKLNPQLIALAGFMLVVQPEFVEHFAGRMINIHPSLLPKYPGLDTHRRALEGKEKLHGCSVHFVDSQVDTGPLIAQASLEVLPNESEQALAARVLQLEHKLYPWVVRNLALGFIRLEQSRVCFHAGLRSEAEQQGFVLGDAL